MRAIRTMLWTVVGIAAAGLTLTPTRSESLPLFARKYNMPCTSCHMAFPRLNKFGMAFRQNGYRMPGAKGESPWESGAFPLSLVGNVGVTVTTTDSVVGPLPAHRQAYTTSAFEQNTVEFHTAGTLAEKVTFHFDNNFAGVSGPLESGMAFVQFDDLNGNGALNFKAGIYDEDIPYIADSRRTTWTHYLAPVTLGAAGMEVNGTRSGWTYAVGVMNSGRTMGKPADKTLNNLEDPYAWLMRDLGDKAMVTARVFSDNQDPRDPTKSGSRHTQSELNAYVGGANWCVIPGFTYEQFADANDTQRDKVMTGMLEATTHLDTNNRWWLTARYELQHNPKFDYQGVTAFPEMDVAQLVANIGYYVNPNAKVAAEFTHLSSNVLSPDVVPNSDQLQLYVHVGY